MSAVRHAWLVLLLLGGCSLNATRPPSPPAAPQAQTQTHPRFAPPPVGNSYWDGRLGVYVLKGGRNLYYRDRTYYRWNDGWSWASNPQGPWQATDSSGVPAGLGQRYARP
ncbi:hypothetical protein F3I16_12110 [Pseudomonas sp. L-22-4S-12]|uniref:hypothetical protein n=1 Tax=Pseudomonas sp. L-22-4S-12 TaxID=2610893 RepID=UPI0013295908|nr:hypothetical protein [Pseudomonas sp. L-22-4S-12]MWV16785.1 hypothetical protein [Pseudomonas sp. L-22-4S-12]